MRREGEGALERVPSATINKNAEPMDFSASSDHHDDTFNAGNDRRAGFSRIQSYYGSRRNMNADVGRARNKQMYNNHVKHEEWRDAHDSLALQMKEILGILKDMKSQQRVVDTAGGGLISRKDSQTREAPF